MGRRIGFFVCADYCNGCQSCRVACREINRVPFDELWLDMTRGKPRSVEGKLRMQHAHVPALDKCALCVEQDETPYCQEVCPSGCIRVGDPQEILPAIMQSDDYWTASFMTIESEDQQ